MGSQGAGGAPAHSQELRPFYWDGATLYLLDQRRLPLEEEWLPCRDAEAVAEAIRTMAVRGAPAIGIAAAFGLVLAARAAQAGGQEAQLAALEEAASLLAATRPTAVNLRWALERLRKRARREVSRGSGPAALVRALEEEAQAIAEEDRRMCLAIGRYGAPLMPDGGGVLTLCHTGALATGGFGTALGVIRSAWTMGKRFRVYVLETRPVLQGARLTAWELVREGIPVTVCADGASGWLMRCGAVQAVVVGADRIAANGDVANKIGTYSLAVLARAHGIPFYVAAPRSTLDPLTPSGERIPVEERPPEEVAFFAGVRVAAPGADCANPAFDVTPAHLVTALITDAGVIYPPYEEALRSIAAVPAGLPLPE